MKIERLSVGLTLAISSVVAAQAVQQVTFTSTLATLERADAVPGELLVRFRRGTSDADLAGARLAANVVPVRKLRLPDLELVRVKPGQTVEAAIAVLQSRPGVLYAEPNFIYRIEATPNDPRFGELWGLNNTGQVVNGESGTADADIDAPEAWNTHTGSAGVVVAVLDTGLAYDHPDIAGRVWSNPGETGGGKETNGLDDDGNGFVDDHRGYDFVNLDNNPRDGNDHGTHVSGTIGAAGNNGIGITGVNWNVRIMPLQVCNSGGSCISAAIVDGIDYAAANGANVANMSFGASAFSQAQKDAIAAASGTLFAVAAGNAGTNNDISPRYPCNYAVENIICVAASTQTDQLASFSNFGPVNVDLAAPGENILSTVASYDTIFFDDFEGAMNWDYVDGPNLPSKWERTTEDFVSPIHSLTDSAGSNYANDSNVSVKLLSPFSLNGRTECWLYYELLLDTEDNYDVLWVEAATGSNGPWTILDGWTGSTGGFFYTLSSALAPFEGQSTVFLRFRLETDFSITYDGATVDDVRVYCPGTAYDGSEYAFFAGTSMASPHVAGAAALLKARKPWASVATLKNSLLTSVDVRPALLGMVATGGRLNLNVALASIPAVTTTTLTSSLNPSNFGQTVVFTATVTAPEGIPAGDVVFKDGATVLGTHSLNASGVAQHITAGLAPGDHPITAHYQGNADFLPSSSTVLFQTVQGSGAQRAFVSAAAGNDANPCSRAAPCRQFAAAISKTAPDGEIIVLDSGGYGVFTISKPISVISATGVYAGITAFSGDAITVNAGASDRVVLRGLTLQGLGGTSGVHFTAGKALLVESCLINGFSNAGIQVDLGADGQLFVTDTTVRNGDLDGITVNTSAGMVAATLDDVFLENNGGTGLVAGENSHVMVRASTSSGNAVQFLASSFGPPSTLDIEKCLAFGNGSGTGIQAILATIRVSNSTITNNAIGIDQGGGATIVSRGNNTLEGNAANNAFPSTFAPQ